MNLRIAGGTDLLITSIGPRTDAGNRNITSVSVYVWIHEDTGNKPWRPGREEDKRGGFKRWAERRENQTEPETQDQKEVDESTHLKSDFDQWLARCRPRAR